MPDIANVLKAEITRLARKELKQDATSLKKAVSAQRSEIVALKRRLQEVEKLVQKLAKTSTISVVAKRVAPEPEAELAEGSSAGRRFSAKGLAANRKRLEVSAADFGLLVGASGQTIYAWESGNSKPRAGALNAIAALRGIGKRQVAERLAALKQ